ncbi:MAG: transglutaminase domain-containing protein [Ruminococcus sp.]|uniref:transglutaminase domain-containing protein n=1 Tax=Ruminococcus sp. TaxID=41978 RepID=UPI0025F37876|nr:transglutaminase domain-containing protein [Ruminococcus sp.]MCR5540814.1 transglutaminase domain-containing protein [Ruminococcus sp.]
MKIAILITIFAVLLTGCGNTGTEEKEIETKAVSQVTTTSPVTASSDSEIETVLTETTDTTTKEVSTTVSERSSAKKTSASSVKNNGTSNKQTDKTVTSQSRTSNQSSSNGNPQNDDSGSKDTENRAVTTTTVQTTPAPKTTTTTLTTTIVTKPVTEQITEVIPEEPAIDERSAIERWLNIFGDPNNKSYYVSIGQGLPNNGSDYSKAQAVYDHMQNRFDGERNCIYMSSVTYALCQGIGLECGYALISDWYNHCANAVKIDGTWYVLDTQASGFLCGDLGYTSILDEYEESLGITLSEDDHD